MRFRPRLPDDEINAPPQNPLRELFVLSVGVFAVGGAILITVSLAAETLAVWMPVSWEVRAFGDLWEGADSGNWESDDRLQALTERIAGGWAENPYDLRVVRADDPLLNAFALPGGTIVVTDGLLDAVESENELAFVLGHELGHFRNRDHMRSLGRRIGGQLVLVTVAGAVGIDFGVQPLAWASEVAERSFGRQQESDADAFALSLLTKEYGHAAGALDFFERVPDPAFMRGVARYVSTHPPSGDRIEALKQLIHENSWDTGAETRPWDGED